MTSDRLRIFSRPTLNNGRLVLAFSGWMDGGDVSTGTVQRLVQQLDARKIAEIVSKGFYIYNFPGSMEATALFRPHVEIEDGLITSLEMPSNLVYGAPRENLALFVGKEPNLDWPEFGECVFELASQVHATEIVFVGSFGGLVPHTRQPRLYGAVSSPELRPLLDQLGVRPSNYEGPSSFASFLMAQAKQRGMRMISLIAEIPSYVEGTNPPSIEAVTRQLAAILGVQVTLAPLRGLSDEWESRVTAAVAKDPDLAKQIRELEERYDDELIEKGEES